jgi:hypothetical protein
LELIHYEAFISQEDAFAREQWLKTGWGGNQVKTLFEKFRRINGEKR